MKQLTPNALLPAGLCMLLALVLVPATAAATAAAEAPSNGPVAAVAAPDCAAAATVAGALPAGPLFDGGLAGAQAVDNCSDCDSSQGYCSQGDQSCRSYCLNLVGEIGFCNSQCNCCVCPEIPPSGPPPADDPDNCQTVCRCGDGVPGPQGSCPDGCRQVSCN